ncbi:DUF4189 domain-containing protein [Mycolicibacterium moriokaense]|nr:DUF4189 domain-containing protein [Mycolicibacterium moriokaense]
MSAINTANIRRHATKTATATMLAAAAVTGAIGAVAPANAAVNRYLAIAYSPATGQWGYTQSLLDANQAKYDAVGYCLNKGGTDCRIVLWGDNECAALATGDNPFNHTPVWGTGIAQTEQLAQSKARLSTPLAGTVVLSFCSLGTEN